MNVTKGLLSRAYLNLEASTCLRCQWRSFSTTYRRRDGEKKNIAATPAPEPAAPKAPSAADLPSPLADAPRAYGKAVEEFTPKPLSRPIGLPTPPRAGENTGVDTRTWKEKRDDFVNYDKHLAKRKMLTQKMSTPYFREWSNMRHHKGKTFLAPPRLFRSDRALYFPNLHGQTLIKEKELRDTTPTLQDTVSIVSVFSSAWAERQAATFVSEKANPELHDLVRESGGAAQIVQVNIEENAMKAALIGMFKSSLRKSLGEANWGRYFVIRKGMTDEMRDAIGLLNSKVGYVYLLDGACRIRWAGSGIAGEDEKEGLVKGVRRLIDEAMAKKNAPKKVEEVKEQEKSAKAGSV